MSMDFNTDPVWKVRVSPMRASNRHACAWIGNGNGRVIRDYHKPECPPDCDADFGNGHGSRGTFVHRLPEAEANLRLPEQLACLDGLAGEAGFGSGDKLEWAFMRNARLCGKRCWDYDRLRAHYTAGGMGCR